MTGRRVSDLLVLGYTAANSTTKDTLWSYTFDGADHLTDFGASICVSDSDHIYVSGQTENLGAPPWTSLYTARLRYAHRDMAASTILAPQGTYNHYDGVIPRAVFTNRGDVMTRFNAFMYVGMPYGDTVQVSDALAPGDSTTVAFSLWQADPTGLVPVRCSLEAVGDVNPTNDFLDDTVRVLAIDVGCRMIVSPTSPVDSLVDVS